jgi:hypothetical protein
MGPADGGHDSWPVPRFIFYRYTQSLQTLQVLRAQDDRSQAPKFQ